jgi:hypothetical protein
MNWYYAKDGQQVGPVDELEFARLVLGVVVTGTTLVWCEGMAQWQPYSQVWREGMPDWRSAAPAAPPATPTSGEPAPVAGAPGATPASASPHMASTVFCAVCGKPFPSEELVRIDGRLVCAVCKPTLLQRVREGAPMAVIGGTMQELDPDALVEASSARAGSVDAMACLSAGWELFKSQPGLLIGCMFVVYLCMIAGSAIPVLGSCVGFAVNGPLMAGLWMVYIRASRGTETSIGDSFCGFSGNWWPLVLANLLISLLTAVPFLPAGAYFLFAVLSHPGQSPQPPEMIIAGILVLIGLPIAMYLALAWLFALPLVVDRGFGAWEAMSVSRRVVNRHLSTSVLLAVLGIAVSLLGVIALCVGVIAAIPVVFAMWACFYEEVLGSRVRQS